MPADVRSVQFLLVELLNGRISPICGQISSMCDECKQLFRYPIDVLCPLVSRRTDGKKQPTDMSEVRRIVIMLNSQTGRNHNRMNKFRR